MNLIGNGISKILKEERNVDHGFLSYTFIVIDHYGSTKKLIAYNRKDYERMKNKEYTWVE